VEHYRDQVYLYTHLHLALPLLLLSEPCLSNVIFLKLPLTSYDKVTLRTVCWLPANDIEG